MSGRRSKVKPKKQIFKPFTLEIGHFGGVLVNEYCNMHKIYRVPHCSFRLLRRSPYPPPNYPSVVFESLLSHTTFRMMAELSSNWLNGFTNVSDVFAIKIDSIEAQKVTGAVFHFSRIAEPKSLELALIKPEDSFTKMPSEEEIQTAKDEFFRKEYNIALTEKIDLSEMDFLMPNLLSLNISKLIETSFGFLPDDIDPNAKVEIDLTMIIVDLILNASK